MTEFALDVWGRANRSLRSAKQLVTSDPDSSVSRAYYAAFHAVTAVFALRGRDFPKHAAVRAAVHRDLVNAGEWDASLGRNYDFLLELRETGDYGGFAHASEDSARMAIDCATRILAAAQASEPKLGESS